MRYDEFRRAVKIRQAALSDVSSLNILVNSGYRGESSKKGWTTEADLLDGIRTNEQDLITMLNKQCAVILVAEEDSIIQGCVYLEQQDDTLYLGMLTVEPELQAKGIGATLMQASEEKAKSLRLKKIHMTVITVRHQLIAYYNRKGYKDTGIRKPFVTSVHFGTPKTDLEFMIMEKILLT